MLPHKKQISTYNCRFPGCGLFFSTNDNANTHYKLQHDTTAQHMRDRLACNNIDPGAAVRKDDIGTEYNMKLST